MPSGEESTIVLLGATVTDLTVEGDGPLQPFAVTCMSTVPVNPTAQVITPVTGSIDPAAESLNDQSKPKLYKAVVEYVVVGVVAVIRHEGSVPAEHR